MSDPVQTQAAALSVEIGQIMERATEALDALHELIDEVTVTQQVAQELRAQVGP